MWISFKLTVLSLALSQPSFAITSDSTKQKVHSLVVTPRFNTLNMAPISGTIINRHVNADLTLVYIREKFTLTFTDAVDIEDLNSEMNYFFVNARYKFNVTKKLSVTPFIAFYSEHAHQFFDVGSDANGGALFGYQHNSFSIEAFALFVRLTHKNSVMDAINRLEAKYRFQHITLSGFVYHNAAYFDNKERVCIGFKLLMPEFKVFKKVNARTEFTGSFKIYELPKTAALSGVFLSLAFPLRF
jgi:hypothetical protein